MLRLKDYLSWSQYSIWLTSKKQYYKKYSLGEESKPNKFFAKGSELSDYLKLINENASRIEKEPSYASVLAESMSSDPLLHQIGKQVPSLDIMEDELNVELQDGSKIKSFVDSVDIENTVFYEYKSGKVDPKGKDAWTQDKVNDHGQLAFYALGYYIKSGRKDVPTCKLVWVETQIVAIENEIGSFSHDELHYTGRVEIFDRGFLVSELVDLEKKIIEEIAAIGEYEYVEMDLDDDIVSRYKYLKQLADETAAEMKTIKTNILTELDIDDIKYASSKSGRFSVTERRAWIYSETLTNSMEESKAFWVKATKLEQKDGTASGIINKSISFKEI
jgi:hypothetical protein